MNRTVWLGGLPVAEHTRDSLTDALMAADAAGQRRVLLFANTNFVVKCQPLKEALDRPDIVITNDGIGLDIAARLVHGQRFPDNLNGTDFVPHFLRVCPRPLRVALLGAKPGVAARAGAVLARQTGQAVVATFDGYDDLRAPDLIERINAAAPDVLLLALGNPIQEQWILEHADKVDARLLMGVGALFDFLCGDKARAPQWVRDAHLEWFYRLTLEPGRLMRRYTVDIGVFLALCLRAGRGPARATIPTTDPQPITEKPPMHAEQADVDVIILSWNRVDDTIAAIRSAHEQQGVALRILIVDQGSEPDNLARLEAFLADVPRATLNKLGRNLGVAGGRNAATAMGSAPYIVALDSDAEFADSHQLAEAVRAMQGDARLSAIGFRILNFFTGKNDDTSWDYPGPGNRPDKRFSTTRFIGAGHCIRRTAFEAVGGYDERLFFCCEEIDLAYRMINLNTRIEYVPEVAIRHKVSPEHRVFWGKGRYFYTVRNSLYSKYKYGTPLVKLMAAAGAYVMKGWSNGIAWEAVRGIRAAIPMCRAFARDPESVRRHYRLNEGALQYIEAREPWRRDGMVQKLQRQLIRLPHQG
ncbi:MAG: WecB/TagA/CpsF family glycosyltransferase [Rhodocyclaceae bacterium]